MQYRYLDTISCSYNDQPMAVKKGQLLTFCTDKYIQYGKALQRILYYPVKHERAVLTATTAWEKNGKYRCVGGFSGKNIVVKGDKLQMFYCVYHMDGKREYRSLAYAESTDGYYWKKPNINKGTNLIIDNRDIYDTKAKKFLRPYYEMQNVIFDEHSQQYIGLGHCSHTKRGYGTFVATTKDPLNWDKKNFRWLYKNADIHALMGWDEDRKCYAAYVRVMAYQNGRNKRAIGISYSEDFKRWTEPALVWQGVGGNQQVYNMPVTKYGGHYLAFPINYYPAKDHYGPLETGLMLSQTGTDWILLDGAYLIRGLPGEWDDCYADTSAPFEWKDSLWFYYWGCNFPHDVGFAEEKVNIGGVGVAVLPKNRLIGLACNRHTPGSLHITPFYLPKEGCKIVLNAHFPNGSIEVYDDFKKLAVVPKNGLEFYLERDGQRDWPKNHMHSVSLHISISDGEVFSVSFE